MGPLFFCTSRKSGWIQSITCTCIVKTCVVYLKGTQENCLTHIFITIHYYTVITKHNDTSESIIIHCKTEVLDKK